MIAYQVTINGILIATIGQEDMSILTSSLVTSRGNQDRNVGDSIRLTLGGMSHQMDDGYWQHFRWKEQSISIGDNIEIEVIETKETDAPVRRYRSDKIVQENPFTDEEIREMRLEDYRMLKKEFGDDPSV